MLHTMRWTSGKVGKRLELIGPLVYRRRHPLQEFRYLKLAGPAADPPVSPQVDDGDWPRIPWGALWGEAGADFVLRTRFQVPPDWDSDAPVGLYLPIGSAGEFSHPEALAYVDGQPLAACDRHHREILLPESWRDGAAHCLALHGWTGGTPALRFDAAASAGGEPDLDRSLRMGRCELVQIDLATRQFVALARAALGATDCLEDTEPARAHLYSALHAAFTALDTRAPLGERFYASVAEAYRLLRAGVERAGPPLDVDVTAVGHAHIDVAWLWTLGQTRRKAGRTFYNAIRLMEQFPEFHFTQSQPQLYEFVRQDYPELFEAIRQRVGEGRWEPVGGMWVEADCNLSGAESLARQFLLGLSYYRQYFGEQGKTPVLWLPDVFGYAWSLPQLVKEAGLRYFFTIKIGWSQYNRFPYDSFWWQGLDGTRILTHFSPTKEPQAAFSGTYNATATPAEVRTTWTNFQQKDCGRAGVTPPLLMAYGYGDGGGGPTREMMESIGEMGALAAMPRVHCGTAAQFFEELEARVGDSLPVWNGELYLEYHRGTYTSQARNKRANRKSEFLLHDAEFLAALAATLDRGYRYPQGELRRAWELICLNQFHDIVPGSSIGEVYEESLRQYGEVRRLGEQARDGALAAIAGRMGGDLLVVNSISFTRSDLAFWPGGRAELAPVRADDGASVPTQAVEGGLLLDVGELAPYSVTPLSRSGSLEGRRGAARRPRRVSARRDRLENAFLRVEFDQAGDIVRIFDKELEREIVPAGAVANQFQLFEDRPRVPDAWDIDIFYDDRMWLAEPAESVEVAEAGPLRAALEIRRRIHNSQVVQRISLARASRRLDFETRVDWQERQMMLKAAFPVEVLTPVATYEIQWGNVQRPTHRNTSWDWARFETCAQKWVDLSEGDYGVSLLNDCKYGHDIHDHVIRLTLLRSPTEPDPEADRGEHHFVYSLLPHEGGWDEFTVAQAYALNDPLIVWPCRQGRAQAAGDAPTPVPSPGALSLVRTDRPNVVIETIKRAEDGEGVIVRLYESQRRRGEFSLATSFRMAEAWRTNLLEENQERLEVEGHRLRCFIKPFQIMTLRLAPG